MNEETSHVEHVHTPEVKRKMWRPRTTKEKVALVALIVLVVGLAAYSLKGQFFAASVNGRLISRGTVISRLEKTGGKSTLDSLIVQALIDDDAAAKGIKISDADIDKQIETLKTQVAAQGGTFDQALAAQGLTLDDLKRNLHTQKSLEQLVGDIQVSDAEVDQIIKDNKMTPSKGEDMPTFRNDIRAKIKNSKVGEAAGKLIADLKAKASIKYFVKY